MPVWSDLKRSALAALVVFITAGVYGLLVVPFIEGAPRERPDLTTALTEVVDHSVPADEDFPGLFQPDAWELGERKKLQVDQGTAFFQDYAPTEAGDLKVEPFTLVFAPQRAPGDSRPPEPPIVLSAPGGAVLTFDQPVKLGVHRPGRLKRAVLQGQVTIDREAGFDTDALHLMTHNIQLQDDFVVTPHRVEFTLGEHRGAGENLMIQLLTDSAVSPDAPFPPVRGIRSLELIKLDYLVLESPPTAAPEMAQEPTEFEIRCGGSFKFDLVASQATLRHQVTISHLGRNSRHEFEKLTADRMTVRFGRRADAPATVGTYGPTLPTPTELQVEEIFAVGAPAILDSPTRQFHAEAALLGYKPIEKQISMQDDTRVILIHQNLRFEAPSLEYSLIEGRTLGRARSVGPGTLKREATPDQEALEIKWSEEMLLRPHNGLDALSLYGHPVLTLGTESSFEAEKLHVWMREIVLPGAPGANSPESKIEPDKMLAEEGVVIDSPQLAGAATTLEVYWDRTPAVTSGAAGGTDSSSGTANNSAAGAGSPLQLRADGRSGPNRRRMRVDGELVRARLSPLGETYEVQEITVEGNAALNEETTEPGVAPLAINGKMLRVESIGQGLFSAYVVAEESLGKATLAARGLELFGAELQMDQRTHRTWMEGPGEAKLRAQQGSTPASQLDGPASVTWQGGLEFDGRVIRIRGQVVVSFRTKGKGGTLSTVQIQGDALDVTLTEQVDFRTQHLSRGNPIELESIRMPGAVVLDHWETTEQGAPISIDRFGVRDVFVDYRTGELAGIGPGWGQSIRAGQAAPIERSATSAPSGDTLTLVRVAFVERMEGNVFQKRLAFVQQVEVLADEAQNWEDWKPRELMLSSPSLVTMKGDRLESAWVQDEQTRQASWEIAMVGNAVVQGQAFDATAQRMVYVESKDLIILEGTQREDAQLTWARRGIAGRDSARARKIMYWKTLGNVDVDGVSAIDATFSGRLNGASRPNPLPRR